MARGIDFSSLTRAERLVLTAALLAYANGFVPWWYRATTTGGTVRFNAGLTGWGVVSVLIAGVIVVAVLLRAAIWPSPAPRADGLVYAVLAGVATGGLAVDAASRTSDWVGTWVALVLSGAVVAAGLARMRERRAGWT